MTRWTLAAVRHYGPFVAAVGGLLVLLCASSVEAGPRNRTVHVERGERVTVIAHSPVACVVTEDRTVNDRRPRIRTRVTARPCRQEPTIIIGEPQRPRSVPAPPDDVPAGGEVCYLDHAAAQVYGLTEVEVCYRR